MGTKVLISYVGSNDPYGRKHPETGEPTTGPILSILEHLRKLGNLPERVILLVTKTHEHRLGFRQEGMEKNAEELENVILREYGAIKVEKVFLEVNPADLDEVIAATLEGLRGKVGGEDEVHINVSSGTQAMSAAIVFLADSGHIPHHFVWQSLDPTKLPAGAERVKQVNLAYLSEGDRLKRALDFFHSMAFSYAEKAFWEIAENSLIPERRPKARAAAKLMKAYALWDRAEFRKALEAMGEAREAMKGTPLIRYLDAQEKVLRELAESRGFGHETGTFIVDMYAAIERRVRGEQFLNVPTRARRLYEGILNHFLCQRGYKLGEWEEIREKREELKKLVSEGAVVELGGTAEEQKEKFKELEKFYSEIRAIRNQSYEEHGLGSVSKEQAERICEVSRRVVETIFAEREVKAYPFGVRVLDEVEEGLRTWFAAP